MQVRLVMVDDDPLYTSKMRKLADKRGVLLDAYSSLRDVGASMARYQAAIVDFDLGPMTGIEVGDYVSEFLRDLPVVLVSSTKRAASADDPWPKSIRAFVHKGEGLDAVLDAGIAAATARA